VRSDAERMAGWAGVDSEGLVAVRIVRGSARGLKKSTAEGDRSMACLFNVVDVQVEVDLLLLAASRPLRRDVIRDALDAHDPFAGGHDAVPVVVAMHGPLEQPGPEAALRINLSGIEHDHAPDDLPTCASTS